MLPGEFLSQQGNLPEKSIQLDVLAPITPISLQAIRELVDFETSCNLASRQFFQFSEDLFLCKHVPGEMASLGYSLSPAVAADG